MENLKDKLNKALKGADALRNTLGGHVFQVAPTSLLIPPRWPRYSIYIPSLPSISQILAEAEQFKLDWNGFNGHRASRMH